MNIEIDNALEAKFRKKAMEKKGYKKGALKAAMEEAIEMWLGGEDWLLYNALVDVVNGLKKFAQNMGIKENLYTDITVKGK